MSKKKSFYLYCFSPAVMLATFVVEVGAALYTIFRYRMNRTAQLITAMLSFLAVFQLAEFMVCEGAFLLSSLEWARLGYAAITILPPLGIHMGLQIAKKRNIPLLVTAYGSAAVFMIFFMFIGQGMQAQQCLGNYVIFTIAPYAVIPYGIYYYGWLITGVLLAWHGRNFIKNENHKKALVWLVFGYLSFMVPTLIVNMINPATIAGIPSIMCGFAIMMSLTLLFKVSPLVLNEKNPLKETAQNTSKS
jgi:hypothetical protein